MSARPAIEIARRTFLAVLLAVAAPSLLVGEEASAPLRVYVGTYTKADGSQGIYQAELNPVDGALKLVGLAGEAKNPSFLALPPNENFLYAVSEVADFDDSNGGAVSAFAVDASGKLALLNHQSSGGSG